MKSLVLLLSAICFSLNLFGQCNALFSWDDTDITIQFTDESTVSAGDQIISWSWDFDDNGNTSSLQNPLYTFSEPDKYDVMLTITTQNGCSSSIEIEIETCVLDVMYNIGVCNSSNQIPVDITINDPWDVADDVDVILDGQSVPGSPFPIDQSNPVFLTVDVPGNGLSHTIQVQSTDIATCGKTIDFIVPDCNSNCFLSGLQIEYPLGVTHTVDVGDDFFSPVSTGIILGDVVNFNWIGDGHSTTSDATTGDDAWNSGVIPIGSSFDVFIKNPGTHPYYCIPHGGPNGSGMSGEILSNCPTGNNLDIEISFNTTVADPLGFNVYYDNVLLPGSPYSYNGVGPQVVTASIAGDNMAHTVLIEDIADTTCTLSTTYDAPDCNQGGGTPVCSMSLSLGQPSVCDANQNVSVDATITMSNGGSGFNLSIDGGTPVFYNYNGPNTIISILLMGDGMSHSVEVVDDTDLTCSDLVNIVTPDCNLPCGITNLTASAGGGGGGGITHNVAVEDFIFNPSVINITEGDIVEWIWTGAVAHTSTSDATSGADSWDSGLLANGDTYTSPVLTQGAHPYYCIPHGSPGGGGMAGTIHVLPPCNAQGEVMVTAMFDITSGGASGFEVFVDGSSVGIFPFAPGAAQSATFNVAGDNMSHTIEIKDVDTPSCLASTTLITPDCNGGGTPVCMIDVSAAIGGSCDANNNVTIDLTVTASDQSATFTVFVDGTNIGSYSYTGSVTNITIDIIGDGQSHNIITTDDVDPNCTSSTDITTPNCNLPCGITNLTASAGGGGGGGMTHNVDVEDFIFNPSVINITEGDIVEWIWTGDIAHTATSDATSGADSWDSGLLANGDTYTSPVLTQGAHPYYCIPHGSTGGGGMAGTIHVLPPCNAQGEVMVTATFDITSGGASGFEVFVDGSSVGIFPYAPGAAQSATFNVAGDNMSHTIEIKDVDTPSCLASTTLITPDCNGGGTPNCMIDVSAAISGSCDANNNVPIDLTVTASDQSATFSVFVDGTNIGSYSYTGSVTNIKIDIIGDGQSHNIVTTDNTDPNCTSSVLMNVPNCSATCLIKDIEIGFGENKTHIISVDDFKFIPDSLNISLGDTIEFYWDGVIPHTATSDMSGGSNSFDSGLLSQGESFQVILTEIGDHPYYCIPHGAPGGVGMAGNINVQPSCDGTNALGNVSFSYEGTSSLGFEILLDGLVLDESPLAFNPNGFTTSSLNLPGDNMVHTLTIADVGNSSCADSIIFTSPDCSLDTCDISLALVNISACEGANIEVSFEVNSSLANELISFYKDGVKLNQVTITTDNVGNASFTTMLAGNGVTSQFSASFDQIPTCGDTINVDLPNCNVPCLITDFNIGQQNNHIVLVRDFDFLPVDLTLFIGDTVTFIWTGVIPHTTTSDKIMGTDSWDSGLLGEGETYQLIIENIGEHPYYCTPHGGPGGIGMAGNITALDTCDGENWIASYNFSVSAGSPLGYNIFVDGAKSNTTPLQYTNPIGFNTGIIAIPGDGETHLITIQDLETNFCAFTTSVVSGQCGVGCTIEDLTAAVGADVIHEVKITDFDFLPANITVRSGETIRFIGIGDIPHTSTSDAITGQDSWDSGLMVKGDTFDIRLQTIGAHPYYCIPHGGPGGIGQSGVINVLPQCQDGNQQLTTSFMANGGSLDGYKLFVDGQLIGTGLNSYDNIDGDNKITFLYPADGSQHIVTIQDADNPICAASAFYSAENCDSDCEIADLKYKFIKNRDTVLVRDFDYLPLNITVESGDTLYFDWVGDIPHTVTSDDISGNSVFNSGLLQKGESFLLILDEIGTHNYYCIPHGGPGGIGMAGIITVVDPCDDDEVLSEFEFSTNKTSGNYDVSVNSNIVIDNRTYSGQSTNRFKIAIPANQMDINVDVIDQVNSDCIGSTEIPLINCSDPCFGTQAAFNYNIDFTTKEVLFTDDSNGEIISWHWDFGDGVTSTLQNPTHTYSDPLVYEVCLIIVDVNGCSDTICDKVRFSSEVCTAAFSYEQNDLTFTFNNTSDYTDPNTQVIWTFGDGDSSMAIDKVVHEFELGIYSICIEIISDSCYAKQCEVIDLSDPCLSITPDFEAIKDGTSLTVQFNDLTSGNPDSWLWGFGDGTTSIEQNPNYTFANIGEYNICLFVQETTNSCSKSFCKKILVGTTGIEEVEPYKTLQIFPNPSQLGEHFKITGFTQNDINKLARISIFDMQGKIIQDNSQLLSKNLEITMEGNPEGAYIINVKTNENIYRAIVLKNR